MANLPSSSWRQSMSSTTKVTLVPIDTTQESRELTLGVGNSITIGRASSKALKNNTASPDNALFENPVISRQHAKLEWRTSLNNHNQVTITDLSSTHGTFVNDEQLRHDQPHPLRHGDVIRLGASVSKGAGMLRSRDLLNNADQIQDSYKALLVTFIIPRNSTANDNRRAFMVPLSSDEEDDYGSDFEDEDLDMNGIVSSSPATSPQSSKKLGTADSPIDIDDDSNRLLPVIIDEEEVNDEEDLDNDNVVQETEQVVAFVGDDEQETDGLLETTFEQPQLDPPQAPDITDSTLEPVSQPIAMTEAPVTKAVPVESHQPKTSAEKDQQNLRWESVVPETFLRDEVFDDDEYDEGPEIWQTNVNPVQLPPVNTLNNFHREPRPIQPTSMYRPWSCTDNTSYTPNSYNRLNSLRPIPRPAMMEPYTGFNGLRPLPLSSGFLPPPPFNQFSQMPHEQRDPLTGLQPSETLFPSLTDRSAVNREAAKPKESEITKDKEDNPVDTAHEVVQDAEVAASSNSSAKKRTHEEMLEQATVPSVSDSPRPIKMLKTRNNACLINEVGKYTLGAAIGATGTFAMLASPLGGMLANWASKL